jgi:hypothetical protein
VTCGNINLEAREQLIMHNNNNNNSNSSNNNNNNTEEANMFNTDPFFSFDSFVDPSMLLPEDVNFESLNASDLALLDEIPALPSEIPSMGDVKEVGGSDEGTARGPGSLYDKLRSNSGGNNGMVMMMAAPNSPAMYPYGSPSYSMASPSSLAMSSDASWMHSNRPRRRRSASSYAPAMTSPMAPMMPMMMTSPPQQQQNQFTMMQPPSPYSPQMYNYHPHNYPHQQSQYFNAPTFMMAPPMSPMNVTVKLPMAPMTPTNLSSSTNGNTKIPLVLPCHLNGNSSSLRNGAAPNISKAKEACDSSASSSATPSRCSSIAPNSSISNKNSSSCGSITWFTEMSATKDRFLQDVHGLDFGNVTVLELKQVLRKFGLNSTGKKAELVERISEISNYLQAEGRKRAKTVKDDESEGELVVNDNDKSIIVNNSDSKVSSTVAV